MKPVFHIATYLWSFAAFSFVVLRKLCYLHFWQTSVNEKLEIARLLNERKRLMENPTIDSTYQDQVKANDTALANFDRYIVDRVVARLPSSFHDVMSDSSTWSQPIHRELRHADKQLDDLEESNFLSL